MITIELFLAILIGLVLAAYITLRVFVFVLQNNPDIEQQGIASLFGDFFGALWLLIFSGIFAIFLALWRYANHVWLYKWAYIGVGIVAVTAEVVLLAQNPLITEFDAAFTEFWPLTWGDIAIPVFNVLRILYDVIICWTNLIQSILRFAFNNFVQIAVECEEMDWQGMVDRSVIMFEAPAVAVVDWIVSEFQDDLDVEITVSAVANFSAAWEPLFNCECLDLNLFWRIQFDVIVSPSLHQAIDRWYNGVISVYRELINLVLALFQGDLPDCDALPTEEEEISCLSERPPKFDRARDNYCLAFIHAFDWLDVILRVSFETFFDVTEIAPPGFELPPVAPLLSSVVCTAISVVNNAVDLIFHVDLVFPFPGNPPVLYIGVLDVENTYFRAYNFSFGINEFWTAIPNPITRDLGCVFSEAANVTISTANLATQVAVQLATDPLNVLDFITENTTKLRNSIDADAIRMSQCAANVSEKINRPLGQVVNETIHVGARVSRMIVELIVHVPDLFGFLATPEFEALVTDVFFEVRALSVASGNFFRQFHLVDDPDICPARDQHADQDVFPQLVEDPLCCLGGSVEFGMRAVGDGAEVLVKTSLDLVSGDPIIVVLLKTANLNTRIIPDVQEFVDNAACIVPSFFVFAPDDGKCPNGADPDATLQAEFSDVLRSTLNFTLSPLILFNAAAVNAAALIFNEHSCDSGSCFCPVLLVLYDVTVGNAFNVVRATGRAFGCLVPEIGNFVIDLTEFLWGSFGWDGPTGGAPINLRDELCSIVDDLILALSFVIKMFTDPGGFAQVIFDAIEDLISEIAAALEDLITELVNQINAYILCIFNALPNFIDQIIDCILSFGIDCDIGVINCPGISLPKRSQISVADEDDPFFREGRDVEHAFRPLEIEWIPLGTRVSDPDSPCGEQFRLVSNDSIPEWAKPMLLKDAEKCLLSWAVARTADLYLLQWNASAGYLVHPHVLYDPMIAMNTLFNLTRGVSAVATYSACVLEDDPSCANVTWEEFSIGRGVRDPLSVRIGKITSIVVEAAIRTKERRLSDPKFGRNAILAVLRLFRMFWKFTAGMWSGDNGITNKLIRIKEEFDRTNMTVKRMAEPLVESVGRNEALNRTWTRLMAKGGELVESSKGFLKDSLRTRDPKIIRNRVGVLRVYNRIADRVRRNFVRVDKRIPDRYAVVISGGPVLSERDLIEPPELCIDDECFNCTLLERTIDDIVDEICRCINETKNGVDAGLGFFEARRDLGDNFTETFAQWNARLGSDRMSSNPVNQKVRELLSAREEILGIGEFSGGGGVGVEVNGTENDGSLAFPEPKVVFLKPKKFGSSGGSGDVFVDFLLNVMETVWKDVINFTALIESVITFFTTVDVEDPESFLFWIRWGLVCDPKTQTRCDPGLGLGLRAGFGWTLLSYVLATLLVALFASYALSYFAYVWLSYPFVLISVAYFISPSCCIPLPPLFVPIMPQCLADDLFQVAVDLNVPCLPWPDGWVLNDTCPGEDEDFRRTFPDCTEAPFDFDVVIRTPAFLTEWLAPDVNEFLRETDFVLFSWINQVDYTSNAITFDSTVRKENGDINGTWVSCFAYSTFNWGVVGFFGLQFFILAFIFFIPVLLLTLAVLSLMAVLLLLIAACITRIGRGGANIRRYYIRRAELPRANPAWYYIPHADLGTMGPDPSSQAGGRRLSPSEAQMMPGRSGSISGGGSFLYNMNRLLPSAGTVMSSTGVNPGRNVLNYLHRGNGGGQTNRTYYDDDNNNNNNDINPNPFRRKEE